MAVASLVICAALTPIAALSEMVIEPMFEPSRVSSAAVMSAALSLTANSMGEALAFCNLPMAVASLDNCASVTPTGALSDTVIELILPSFRELSAAEMFAAVSLIAKPPDIVS